ncbi:replication protein [Brevibacillus choshinensis]|uniref:conserved phage C-terminal domain-containing protein n=1 Tax=Brevibacillus choshinensis TaxID=54911 RepID=UPI003D1DCECF
MATYRQVHTSFWQDGFVIDLTPEEKYFFLYLMTNSKTTQCGIYELPMRIIEIETGYNRDTIGKLMDRFIGYGKILYSESTKEMMVLNWLKYNKINSPKVKACIVKELENVKYKPFIDEFYTLCIRYGYGIDTVHIDSPEEEEQEKEEEEKKKKKASPKRAFAEYVSLTEEEYAKLVAKYGQDGTARMIDILNNYKGSKGKTYKSDYMAILNWVVLRYQEENTKKTTTSPKEVVNGSFVNRYGFE